MFTGLLAAGLSTPDEKLISAKLGIIKALQSRGTEAWQIYAFHLGWSIPLLMAACCLVRFEMEAVKECNVSSLPDKQ